MATRTEAEQRREERLALAERRLRAVLRSNVVATARTLEQKISDAGPGAQRVDPHILTAARKRLMEQGVITRRMDGSSSAPWFHLTAAAPEAVAAKLALVKPVHDQMMGRDVLMRVGQTLEIATYRALLTQPALHTFGSYPDLEEHDDGTLYKKEEPPSSISGRTSLGKLDFLVIGTGGAVGGIEVKNIREWVYPNRHEVIEALRKCTALDVVPVLIARRIPYVTFKLLHACGAIVHQTYNQLFPEADTELASKVRDKHLLGYHDVRTGNQPDARLQRFVTEHLPGLLVSRRPVFDAYKDLLLAFATEQMSYAEFAARVRRREQGTNEDGDWPEPDEGDGYY